MVDIKDKGGIFLQGRGLNAKIGFRLPQGRINPGLHCKVRLVKKIP